MAHLSPALRHKARALAAKAAANAPEGHLTAGSAYELMLYKLAEDRRRLKQIQSVKQKIALKAEILPEYQDWIDGVLSAGKGAQDDVLTTLLVWCIDVRLCASTTHSRLCDHPCADLTRPVQPRYSDHADGRVC